MRVTNALRPTQQCPAAPVYHVRIFSPRDVAAMRKFLEVFRNRALDVMSSALPAESLLEDFALALQAR